MNIKKSSEQAVAARWKILIIDDDEDDFLLARSMLREARERVFDIRWASTYAEGQQELFSDQYDVVLVDYDIGSHTGIELIRAANERGIAAPLILFTGRGSYEIDMEAMQAGATLYLTKTEANPLLLERFIRYAIERKQKEYELRQSRGRLEQELAERKKAQEALRVSEMAMDAFFASSPGYLILLDQNLKVLRSDAITPRYYGYDRERIVGKSIWDIDSDVARTIFAPALQRVIQSGESEQNIEFWVPIPSRQNEPAYFRASFFPVPLPEGEVGLGLIAVNITEQKQAQEQLAYNASLLDNIHDAIIANDVDQRITAWNKAAEKLYGYTAEEAIGKIHGELLRNELTHEQRASMLAQLETIGEYSLEVVQYTRSGKRLVVEGKTIPRRDIQGKITAFVTANRDITDRKQAEEELRKNSLALLASNKAHQESEARLREFLESTNSNYIALDRNWCFTYANRHYGEVMGIDPEELIGKNYWDLFPQYQGTKLEENYRKVMAEGIPLQYRQGGIYTKNMYDVSVSPTREGLAIYSIDRTDELHHQEQLEYERARLETVLQSLPVGVWISDAQGRILGKNQQTDRIWAGNAPMVSSTEEYREYPSWDAHTGRALQIEEYPLSITLRTGQPVDAQEHRIRRLDGSQGTVLVSTRPILDKEGRVTGAVAVNVDISEQKQVEAKLQEKNEALRESERAIKELAKRFQDVLENSLDVVYRRDLRSDTYDYVSPVVEQILGFSAQEMMAMSLQEALDRIHPEDVRAVETGLAQSAEFGKGKFEYRFKTKSGKYRWVADHVTVSRDADGNPVYRTGILRDVTEQHLLLEENQRQQDLLERLIQTVPAGITFIQGPQHVHSLANDVYREQIARGKGELIGRKVADVWREIADDVIPQIDQVYQTGKPLSVTNAPLNILRSGQVETGYFSYSFTPIFAPDGSIEGVMNTVIETTSEVQARQALEAQTARLEAVLQALPVAVWLADPNGRILFKNEQVDRIWGEDAPLSSGIDEYREYVAWFMDTGKPVAADDFPVAQALKTGQPGRATELRIRRFDGAEGAVLAIGAPIKDREGRLTGAVAINVDISESKQVEAALEVERAKLAAAINHMPVGICIADPHGNILSLNDAGVKLHGFHSAADILGRVENVPLKFELRNPDGTPIPIDSWPSTRALRGDFVNGFEAVLHNLQNGFERMVSYRAIPVNDNTGQILLILYILEDLTERKLAEEALRSSEAHFRHLSNAMPQLVWSAKADGIIDYCNSRCEEYDGIMLSPEKTWEWGSFLHPEDIGITQSAWQCAVHTGEKFQIEHRARMRNGAYRWHLSRGVPITDQNGIITRWYGTTTDIEDQKQNEDRLRRSNQELEQFAMIASHDLQEPLRKIIMFGNSLRNQMGELNNETANSTLERMQNSAERMQTMIDGLLALSRVSTRASRFTPVNLALVMEEVLSDLENRIRATQGQVIVGDLPEIYGDGLQIHQLMQNLVGNALKFHKPDLPPIVHVAARMVNSPKGPTAEITVRDNGIGFEQQYAERIFQPFQRLHSRAAYEGTGLGLSICLKIVERHQGKIEVWSSPGQGSTFTVRLPLQPG